MLNQYPTIIQLSRYFFLSSPTLPILVISILPLSSSCESWNTRMVIITFTVTIIVTIVIITISVITKTTFSAIDRFSRSSLFSAASYLKMIKSFWQFLVLVRMVLVKVKMVIKMKMIKTWQSTSFICLVTPLT